MNDFLIVIGTLTVFYIIFKILTALLFRFKILRIIVNDLKYNPAVPGWQAKAFLDATKMTKLMRGNEYDAAIIFMLSQIEAMTTSNETRSFKIEKYALMEKIVPKSILGDDLINDHARIKH